MARGSAALVLGAVLVAMYPKTAAGEPGHGQFRLPGLNLPGPLNSTGDLALRTALSQFGRALGAQLPIELSPDEAYPTGELPGAGFAAHPRELAVASALRGSSDGTVQLAPGDYAFPVDVFCMKAHASSPMRHSYRVAPLHGGAADIFRTLNQRLPGSGVGHHEAQVLSWNIQAALPYARMQAAQQQVVDRLLPEYRSRLEGDLFTQLRAQYDDSVGRIPGSPSFDGALGRLGAPGQALLSLQQLRDEMTAPSPTFDDWARRLVPSMPAANHPPEQTPWSRYSDRVYVRFVTAGNYATPGTYQVRVLPEATASLSWSWLGLGSSTAAVPFTNVVNNPGVNNVQPLTQTPGGGGGSNHAGGPPTPQGSPTPQPSPTPSPSPSPSPRIISQTEAPVPANRDRVQIGVNEIVHLTFTEGPASWSLSGSGGFLVPHGATADYTASLKKATETITATDPVSHKSATITFQVTPPTGILFEMVPPALVLQECPPKPPSDGFSHHQGSPDVGFYARMYLQPDTVSFAYIQVRERKANFDGTGYYQKNQGDPHDPDPQPSKITQVIPGKGSLLVERDHVWSGRWADVPLTPGSTSVTIPWEYATVDADASDPYLLFCSILQSCTFQAGGQLTATKANLTRSLTVDTPTTF